MKPRTTKSLIDPILAAAKRDQQAQSRALVANGQRTQASMFLFSPSAMRKVKIIRNTSDF